MGKRILKVKGKGKARAIPDQVVITFDIEVRGYDYDQVMTELNQKTNRLKNDIEEANFNREDVKTTDFTIRTNYKYVDGQRIFDGFIANHKLKLTFDLEKEKLNTLVRVLSVSESEAQFNINFEVKDKETFKNRVLEDAVQDAKRNATVIAESAGIKLEKILTINYDLADVVFRSELILEDTALQSTAAPIDIEPEEVITTDTITIEWEIES
ncbi:SIMPL domain-containing protein [Haloplasma contractile]|uniref:DUF541 domain-containing protein n=1 Tax=Haloplasma contractile SSD-17B TaxID=1033810 RepID=U2DUH9_9MOLU|nr:SIMPL domain-containing protein [Haloplasma contractile]ERJ12057.1 hypothetical protein HLPCO_001971 [Haloplasma contractile SSD-17B]